MPRPERHPVDKILDASRDLVLSEGARSVTVDRIVAVSGAPKALSTIGSRVSMTCWQRCGARVCGGLRHAFSEPLKARCGSDASAVAAGLAIHDFAKENRADARLLAALR